MGVVFAASLVVNGAIMLFDFQVPALQPISAARRSPGSAAAAANMLLMAATRAVACKPHRSGAIQSDRLGGDLWRAFL